MSRTSLTSASDRPLRGADLSITDPKARIEDFLSFAREPEYHGFDTLLLPHLTLLSSTLPTPSSPSPPSPSTPSTPSTPSLTIFSLVIPPTLTNRMSNLHGGAASLIFDVCTTCALVPYARRGFWQFAGVTRSLNVSYLRPAKLGQKVEVRCEVVSIGKRLATVRGEIWGEVEGDKGKEVEGGQKRLMVCEHLKVGIDPPVRGEGAKL